MSEPNDEMNTDLAPVEDALRILLPKSGTVNRDRVMFDAGRASATITTSVWWKCGTIASALTAMVFAVLFFIREPDRVVELQDRVVEVPVYIPVEVPLPEPKQPNLPSSEPSEVESIAMEKPSPEAMKMMQVRREVLRWGPDMLPRSPAPIGPKRDAEAELTRWLNLPPGTLTAPYTPPTLFPRFRGEK